jgi:hypothetical protein
MHITMHMTQCGHSNVPATTHRAKPRMQSVLTEKLAEVRADLMKLPLLLAADPHSDLLRMIEELSGNIQDQVGAWPLGWAGLALRQQHVPAGNCCARSMSQLCSWH